MSKIAELIKIGKATIVDVRSPREFQDGHADNSLNIPVKELADRLAELKEMDGIILCCASGTRSRQAYEYLSDNGITCFDGGPWQNVQYLINDDKKYLLNA